MTLMTMDVADALLRMDEPLANLRAARATLSKLVEGCVDDPDPGEALHFVAAAVSDNTSELQRLWELATGDKRAED
jgi:hypothetical protein